MCCAREEVSDERKEARYGEAALLAENHRRGGAEWDVDSRVLPSAAFEGSPVLLVAAQTESGSGGTEDGKAHRPRGDELCPGQRGGRKHTGWSGTRAAGRPTSAHQPRGGGKRPCERSWRRWRQTGI